jgi:hypothetical protein
MGPVVWDGCRDRSIRGFAEVSLWPRLGRRARGRRHDRARGVMVWDAGRSGASPR